LVLACGSIKAVCRGDTDAVRDEAESEAFRGAMVETEVVLSRVGKCEEGASVVGWGVVGEGF
jgi:hypothetical protein